MHINSSKELKASTEKLQGLMTKGCTVVLNHSEYCGHCHAFMPEWNKFERASKGTPVKVVKIEGSAYSEAVEPSLFKKLSDNSQLYFPMVIVFIYGKRFLYQGERTASSLKQFVVSKMNAAKQSVASNDNKVKPRKETDKKPKAKKAPKKV